MVYCVNNLDMTGLCYKEDLACQSSLWVVQAGLTEELLT